MSSKNLCLDLKSKTDVDGRTFYVAKLKFPGHLDCRNGATFLVFVSDKGEEELQIACMDEKSDYES